MSWQAVALSRDIETSTAADLMIDGHERVIWRDAEGTAHVWADRCPHRGMRLSFGFVRGDRLACLYHGWQYDRGGGCRLIPAHPELDVPATIRAETFPTIERAGLVWVWRGDGAAEGEPDIGADKVTPVRSLVIEVAFDRLAKALAEADAAGLAGSTGPAKPLLLAPNLWRIETVGGAIFLAGHRIAAERSSLHVVMTGSTGPSVDADAARGARWCEALRDALEVRDAVA